MSEELRGVAVGAVLSGLVAVALWWFSSRAELAWTRLQIDAQTLQTRYPDLVRAASAFASSMRRLNTWHLQCAEEHGYGYGDDPGPTGDWVPRDEPEAEVALATLEFFADDALRDARRAWLEPFYLVSYDPSPKKLPEGVKRPDELLAEAGKRFVAEVRKALKGQHTTGHVTRSAYRSLALACAAPQRRHRSRTRAAKRTPVARCG
ncbi:hypothetical protein [Cellulomonas sp. Root137]|uniref:hypothetical protein n=1 Tax=Cellulomonas sp. Root137 TaxID=1736459 RepID=UPI0006FE172B|nr:hypothetical protein [Cellulomonas sp. Root137]KQY41485.1 hypothetical protein ASD18_20560 [Cellulomonas sp. Root137]